MYNTKQKKLLTEFLEKNNSKQFSINEILSNICPDGLGKSTIYRLISKMVNDGTMLRVRGDDGKSILYQYVPEGNSCHEHFHLKCIECGRLIHLDCHELEHIGNHICDEHDFILDTKKTVLYGKCTKCI